MSLVTLEAVAESPARTNFIDEAVRLVPLLRQEARAVEQGRQLTAVVHDAYVRAGFYRTTMPEDPRSLPEIMRVLETLATGDTSCAWCAWTPLGVPAMSAFMDEAGTQELFARPDACVVSSVAGMGRAVPVDGGYRVSGRWGFMSNVRRATAVGALALVYDGEEIRVGPDGQAAPIVAVWPVEECTIIENWETTGLQGTGSHDVELDNVFVPLHRTADFTREPRVLGPVHRVNVDTAANITLAAIAIGTAAHVIEAFQELALAKKLIEGGVLADSPQARIALGLAETRLAQARGHLYETADLMWETLVDGTYDPADWFARTALVSTAAADAAIDVAISLYRAAATSAIRTGVLDRAVRDLLTLGAHKTVQQVNLLKYGGASISRS